jgi:methyltransferase (TIGR00027 family)
MNGMRRKYIFPCLLISACLLTAPAAAPSLAAQLGDIPVMEEFAAGLRAIAAMDPDENIRNPDTMARQFLAPAFWFWTALDEDYEQSKKFIKYYRVSAYYTQNACTKHIDGILLGAAGNGIKQVVIIGAGLDSRAYRFQQQLSAVRLFEVDLPAAIARKQELIQAAVGRLPETVAYVSADVRNGEIGAGLKQAGYNPGHKTLFIWEGVTRYIDANAVNRTLTFISENTAPGSELVFDYIFEDIANGDFSKMPWARFQSVRMAAYGHPWKFGIAPGKAGDFVTRRGFRVVSDLGAKELAQRYLVRSDGKLDGQPTPYFRILHAVLKP